MATPKKTPQGTWRVQLEIKGVRDSATYATRREAQEWADRRAIEIRAAAGGKTGEIKTLQDALRKYAEEVSSKRKGAQWEIARIAAFQGPKHMLPLKKTLASIDVDDLILWRDDRLRQVKPGSVLREIGLLQSVFNTARLDWRWIKHDPFSELRKPPTPPHRDRLVSGPELRKLLRKLGHQKKVETIQQAIGYASLFTLFTGMRSGEITALKWTDVKGNYVVLHTSKTGLGRNVPLTKGALSVLNRMRGFDDVYAFKVDDESRDVLFRKARARAGLSGFTFHDLRHTATTRLARKLHPMDLARMMGWKDLKMAMRYYNATASDIAKQLAA